MSSEWMSLILLINQLFKPMSSQTENQQEEEASKTPKPLYYHEVVEMVNKAFRSKNLLSESNPPPIPPKETIIEVTFIKRTKN